MDESDWIVWERVLRTGRPEPVMSLQEFWNSGRMFRLAQRVEKYLKTLARSSIRYDGDTGGACCVLDTYEWTFLTPGLPSELLFCVWKGWDSWHRASLFWTLKLPYGYTHPEVDTCAWRWLGDAVECGGFDKLRAIAQRDTGIADEQEAWNVWAKAESEKWWDNYGTKRVA